MSNCAGNSYDSFSMSCSKSAGDWCRNSMSVETSKTKGSKWSMRLAMIWSKCAALVHDFTDFLRCQCFRSLQVKVKIRMAWDAQQRQVTGICWSIRLRRAARLWFGWVSQCCAARWLIGRIVSGLMERRRHFAIPPSGSWWSRCRRHRCRRWRPRKSSGRRLIAVRTIRRRQSIRRLDCRRVQRLVLNQFHVIGERLHYGWQVTVAQLWRTIVKCGIDCRRCIHYRCRWCIIDKLPWQRRRLQCW